MITDETYDLIDDIIMAFGSPRYNDDSPMTDDEGNLYPYIVVVKGEDETWYDGFESWDEAREKCDEIVYDSVVDWECGGVWAVVAVVETATRRLYYPTYRVTLPEQTNGFLDNHLM